LGIIGGFVNLPVEMTDLFMTWENDWNGASNKCAHMTVEFDPMPRDYQPIKYDSAGNPLTMATRARENIVNSEQNAQRRAREELQEERR